MWVKHFKNISLLHFFLLDDLRRIDLTSNLISEIDEDAFRKLPQLQELVLRDNKIRQLPELPNTLTFIDVSNNRLGRKGIKQEAFKVSFRFGYKRLSSSHSICSQWLAVCISAKEFTLMRFLTSKVNFTTLFIMLSGNPVLRCILRLAKHQEQKAEME